jgi:hypothetical protein
MMDRDEMIEMIAVCVLPAIYILGMIAGFVLMCMFLVKFGIWLFG